MDHPRIATPHLDRQAAQSLTFACGYTPADHDFVAWQTEAVHRYGTPYQHGGLVAYACGVAKTKTPCG